MSGKLTPQGEKLRAFLHLEKLLALDLNMESRDIPTDLTNPPWEGDLRYRYEMEIHSVTEA